MSDQLSPRQQVLRKIWDSRGPAELMTIMKSSPAARDLSLVEELKNQASACEFVQPQAAEHLGEISEALQRIHDWVREFANVKDTVSLVRWYRLSPLCFSSEFFPLVDEFLKDGIPDAAHADALKHALAVRTKILNVVSTLPTIKIADEIEHEPLLTDPAFHDLLETFSRYLVGADKPAADGTRRIAAHLRYVTRLNAAFKRIKEEPTDSGRVRLPSDPVAAELWFFVDKDTAVALAGLAQQVASNQIVVEEAVKKALVLVGEALAEPGPLVTVYGTAALCEHLLRTGSDELVASTIDLYKTVIDGKAAEEIEVESRATFVLRYTGASRSIMAENAKFSCNLDRCGI
jgi:hypothetical protein